MPDLPFGLETKNTYAALSPADLQSMGKQAAAAYLCGGTSLNDAIIKLARQHPSISPHQVQRVVEFANQETFAKLFADNEKYASDKNIEFDVADPSDVLLELNNGAKPQVMSATPSEYSSDPVKFAHSEAEADLVLAKEFLGVDWASPGSEKTSMAQSHVTPGGDVVIDRILPLEKAAADVADRVLASGEEDARFDNSSLPKNEHPQSGGESHDEETQKVALTMQGPVDELQPDTPVPAAGGGSPDASPEDHHEQMLDVQREIELAKKRQELQKIQQQTLDGMNPQGPPGGAPAPGPAMPAEGGPPPGAPPAPPGGAPVEMAPPPPPPEQMPAPAAGPITAPPGAEMPKTGAAELTKQALAYVKEGRPHARLVLEDLKAATSLDRIKQATAAKGGYPMANPYGELIRCKQKLAKLYEDSTYAKGKNEELHKEATARFQKAVSQHLWDGGNFGEVAHLMSTVSDDQDTVKTAMDVLMPELLRQGLDPVRARAEAIEYEMVKGAGVRRPNPEHPIAQAYLDLCKLAEGNVVLEAAHNRIKSNYEDVDKVLTEAMAQNAASL